MYHADMRTAGTYKLCTAHRFIDTYKHVMFHPWGVTHNTYVEPNEAIIYVSNDLTQSMDNCKITEW